MPTETDRCARIVELLDELRERLTRETGERLAKSKAAIARLEAELKLRRP